MEGNCRRFWSVYMFYMYNHSNYNLVESNQQRLKSNKLKEAVTSETKWFCQMFASLSLHMAMAATFSRMAPYHLEFIT